MMTKRHRPVHLIMTVMFILTRTDVSLLLATCREHHGVRPPLEDMTTSDPELKKTSGDARNKKVSNPGVEEKVENSVTVVQVTDGTAIITRATKQIGVPDISGRIDQSQAIGHIDCRKPQTSNGKVNH